ncbi:ABC transporter substrate-binding protein [Bradyrhizobium sp. LHD-71]|uniref:ABC transporter substrate-binding protein n=1 Tax=Bradyrhizobium sp. LHD-71 TaxID=3072141 RepID=UPI00280EA866|nr:ABC transporter substrate-binding protein [Bradyrhizobium sp. LHD-71]MDQ8730666.1 ABC transporter substrate-binding protein [Bradyrhizobium sp. LHD-71]
MRVQPAVRSFFLLFAALSTLALLGAFSTPADAATAIRFTLDRRIDGAAVPFAVAMHRGLYRAEDLDVATTAVNGSAEALAKLAKGEADIALADFNELIRYRDGANGTPLKAVFIMHNENGYAIIARRSRGVDSVTDLQGKTIGVAEGDLAIRMWPSLAKRVGLDASKVKLEKIGAAVREPMLSAGQVDAVSGMSYASAINVRDRGVPRSDLLVIRFTDFGDRSYGRALVVNPAFAAANPDAVSRFIRAVINGVRFAVKDPVHATEDVLAQMDGGSRELEQERVRAILHDNIVTPEVRRDGIGDMTAERFDASLEQIAVDYKFRNRPAAQDVFNGAFLPPATSRKIE